MNVWLFAPQLASTLIDDDDDDDICGAIIVANCSSAIPVVEECNFADSFIAIFSTYFVAQLLGTKNEHF